MTRNKPPQDVRDRREETAQKQAGSKQPTELTVGRKLLRWGGAAALVATSIATSLGIVTGYLSLVPRISVSQNLPLSPDDPFSAPFVISNDGPLGINDATASCLIIHLRTSANQQMENNSVSNFIPPVGGMEPGERATVPCQFPPIEFSAPFTELDITIGIRFRPDFVTWHTKRDFRFVALRGSDGKFYWYPQPYTRLPHKTLPPPG